MNDFVQLQEDLAQGLLSEPTLRYINVLCYRKLRWQSELEWSAVYTNPRNGRAGCGVIVEMPTFEVLHPNVSGPVGHLVLSCVVVEEPDLNFEPATGTQLSAEAVAKFILDSSHQWEIGGAGVLSAVREAIRGLWRTEDLRGTVSPGPLRDVIWDAQRFAGLVAYRVKLQMQAAGMLLARVAPPAAAVNVGQLVLSCAKAGADVYYTLDGSFPGPANSAATLYTAPLPLPASTVRFAAYQDGLIRSHVGCWPPGA